MPLKLKPADVGQLVEHMRALYPDVELKKHTIGNDIKVQWFIPKEKVFSSDVQTLGAVQVGDEIHLFHVDKRGSAWRVGDLEAETMLKKRESIKPTLERGLFGFDQSLPERHAKALMEALAESMPDLRVMAEMRAEARPAAPPPPPPVELPKSYKFVQDAIDRLWWNKKEEERTAAKIRFINLTLKSDEGEAGLGLISGPQGRFSKHVSAIGIIQIKDEGHAFLIDSLNNVWKIHEDVDPELSKRLHELDKDEIKEKLRLSPLPQKFTNLLSSFVDVTVEETAYCGFCGEGIRRSELTGPEHPCPKCNTEHPGWRTERWGEEALFPKAAPPGPPPEPIPAPPKELPPPKEVPPPPREGPKPPEAKPPPPAPAAKRRRRF